MTLPPSSSASSRSSRAFESSRAASSARRCRGTRCTRRSPDRPSPCPLNHRRTDGGTVMVDQSQVEKLVIDGLRTVYDPEIPVNIYELGLIYGVAVEPAGRVTIRMTLTAAGCPAAQSLPLEVEQRARAVPGVTDVKVDVVFDPPWDQSLMSEAARLELGLL